MSKRVEDYVRSIPDFPEEGIIFRDITTVLQDKVAFPSYEPVQMLFSNYMPKVPQI